jgi:hypothetical protein
MLKMGAAAAVSFLFAAAVVAQTPSEPPPEKPDVKTVKPSEPDAKAVKPRAAEAEVAEPRAPEAEIVRLRKEVERLQRALEKQQGLMERQIDDLKTSMESKLSGLTNGIDAVRISVDAVKNAIASIPVPKRPPIAIVADPSAPIVCGELGCEATALNHCRKSGYAIAHVVNKLEKPAQWLFAFTCRDS